MSPREYTGELLSFDLTLPLPTKMYYSVRAPTFVAGHPISDLDPFISGSPGLGRLGPQKQTEPVGVGPWVAVRGKRPRSGV